MEHKIVFATSNAGKMREIREILKDLGAEILSMKEAGVDIDIVEDGDTFAANALIKAKAVWEKTGGIVLADDSGLVIDALNGEPGVYSARYAGEIHNSVANIQLLLRKMENITDREAYMQTVLVLMYPDGQYYYGEGTVRGTITRSRRGFNGFGYDSVFYSPQLKKTFAEASFVEKQSVSHRLQAVNDLFRKVNANVGAMNSKK